MQKGLKRALPIDAQEAKIGLWLLEVTESPMGLSIKKTNLNFRAVTEVICEVMSSLSLEMAKQRMDELCLRRCKNIYFCNEWGVKPLPMNSLLYPQHSFALKSLMLLDQVCINKIHFLFLKIRFDILILFQGIETSLLLQVPTGVFYHFMWSLASKFPY